MEGFICFKYVEFRMLCYKCLPFVCFFPLITASTIAVRKMYTDAHLQWQSNKSCIPGMSTAHGPRPPEPSALSGPPQRSGSFKTQNQEKLYQNAALTAWMPTSSLEHRGRGTRERRARTPASAEHVLSKRRRGDNRTWSYWRAAARHFTDLPSCEWTPLLHWN